MLFWCDSQRLPFFGSERSLTCNKLPKEDLLSINLPDDFWYLTSTTARRVSVEKSSIVNSTIAILFSFLLSLAHRSAPGRVPLSGSVSSGTVLTALANFSVSLNHARNSLLSAPPLAEHVVLTISMNSSYVGNKSSHTASEAAIAAGSSQHHKLQSASQHFPWQQSPLPPLGTHPQPFPFAARQSTWFWLVQS